MIRYAGNLPVVRGFVITIVMALVALLTIPAQAQPGGGSSYKIGVVDLELILKQYKKRIELYDALQKEVDKMQEDIDAMSKNIEAARDEYEKNKSLYTEDELMERRNQIEADYANYQVELKKRQNTIDVREKKALEEVLDDVRLAIEKVGNRENYHLILNSKSGPRGSVLFHSPTIDITPVVLTELNES